MRAILDSLFIKISDQDISSTQQLLTGRPRAPQSTLEFGSCAKNNFEIENRDRKKSSVDLEKGARSVFRVASAAVSSVGSAPLTL